MEQPVSAARDQAPGRGASAGHPRGFYREPPALHNTISIFWVEAENDHMPPIKGDDFSVWNRVPPGVICAPTKGGPAAPQCSTAAAAAALSQRSRRGGYEPPAGARCAPLRKGAPLRRSAAWLPLLPASSRWPRRGGYEPPAGRMICALTKGGPAAPQCSTAAAAARPVPAVS